MTRDEIIAELKRLNPKARDTLVQLWARSFIEFKKAEATVARYGLVMRDEVGKPHANPAIRLRDNAADRLMAIHIKTGDLWSQESAE